MRLKVTLWQPGDSLPVNDFPVELEAGFLIYTDHSGVVRAVSNGNFTDDQRFLYVYRQNSEGQWPGSWLHNSEFQVRATLRFLKGKVSLTAPVVQPMVSAPGCKT